jgi:uncharacterized protein
MNLSLTRSKISFLAVLVAVVASLAFGAGKAAALNPETQDPQQIVNTVYWSTDNTWSHMFASWHRSYYRPGVVWYNAGQAVAVPAACDFVDGARDGYVTLNQSYNDTNWRSGNSFYCPANSVLYLDYRFFSYLASRGDDYEAGVILAHEFGHHIQHLLGLRESLATTQNEHAQFELEADCFAGIATHYGYLSGVITASDAQWGSYMLSLLGDDLPWYQEGAHGSGQLRSSWFNYGYRAGNAAGCFSVYH